MQMQLHADDGRARDPGGSPFACESGCARPRERRAVGARPLRKPPLARAWCPRSRRSSGAGVSGPTPPRLAPPVAGLAFGRPYGGAVVKGHGLMAIVWVVMLVVVWLRLARRPGRSRGSRRVVMLIFGGWLQDLCSSYLRRLKSSAAARGWVLRRRIAECCTRAGMAGAASPTATGCVETGLVSVSC